VFWQGHLLKEHCESFSEKEKKKIADQQVLIFQYFPHCRLHSGVVNVISTRQRIRDDCLLYIIIIYSQTKITII
jgi:hypothetical protein